MIFVLSCRSTGLQAAESGFGNYLLGSKGIAAGIVAPPGVYIVSQHVSYNGDYLGPIAGSGSQDVRVNVDLAFEQISPVWITPIEIAGGNLGFGVTVPVGFVGVRLDTPARHISDERMTIGDPLFSAFVGWHQARLHWNLGITAVAPVGDYDANRLANLSLNRPSLDVFDGVTWSLPQLNLEMSGALGVTFNGENSVTHYRSGTELHGEWAISTAITPQFAIGLTGYHYEQLTDDTGPNVVPGGFRGRVSAVGLAANYRGTLGDTAFVLRAQAIEEFNTKNRFQATPIFVNLVIGSFAGP